MAGWVPVLGYTLRPDKGREETGSSMLQLCPGPDPTFTERASMHPRLVTPGTFSALALELA
jgi:hypothetical protein